MKIVNKILFVLFFTVVLSCNNNDENKVYTIYGNTMGTTYNIKIVMPSKTDENKIRLLKFQIDSLLQKVNLEMSTYIDTSEISKFNKSRNTNWIDISPNFAFVTKEALRICELSEGALDITVSPLVNIWGFGHNKKPTIIPSIKEINKAKKHIGYKKIFLKKDFTAIKKEDPNMQVTLATIAKGFAVDYISKFILLKGIKNSLVEIGGEVRVCGSKLNNQKWRVGIATPDKKMGVQKVVALKNYSMATSGDYYNYFEEDGVRYSHIINPKTGKPIKHKMVSVTVLNKSCATADGLATAIFVMGPQKGFNFAVKNQIPIYMITKEGDKFVEKSTNKFNTIISEGKK